MEKLKSSNEKLDNYNSDYMKDNDKKLEEYDSFSQIDTTSFEESVFSEILLSEKYIKIEMDVNIKRNTECIVFIGINESGISTISHVCCNKGSEYYKKCIENYFDFSKNCNTVIPKQVNFNENQIYYDLPLFYDSDNTKKMNLIRIYNLYRVFLNGENVKFIYLIDSNNLNLKKNENITRIFENLNCLFSFFPQDFNISTFVLNKYYSKNVDYENLKTIFEKMANNVNLQKYNIKVSEFVKTFNSREKLENLVFFKIQDKENIVVHDNFIEFRNKIDDLIKNQTKYNINNFIPNYSILESDNNIYKICLENFYIVSQELISTFTEDFKNNINAEKTIDLCESEVNLHYKKLSKFDLIFLINENFRVEDKLLNLVKLEKIMCENTKFEELIFNRLKMIEFFNSWIKIDSQKEEASKYFDKLKLIMKDKYQEIKDEALKIANEIFVNKIESNLINLLNLNKKLYQEGFEIEDLDKRIINYKNKISSNDLSKFVFQIQNYMSLIEKLEELEINLGLSKDEYITYSNDILKYSEYISVLKSNSCQLISDKELDNFNSRIFKIFNNEKESLNSFMEDEKANLISMLLKKSDELEHFFINLADNIEDFAYQEANKLLGRIVYDKKKGSFFDFIKNTCFDDINQDSLKFLKDYKNAIIEFQSSFKDYEFNLEREIFTRNYNLNFFDRIRNKEENPFKFSNLIRDNINNNENESRRVSINIDDYFILSKTFKQDSELKYRTECSKSNINNSSNSSYLNELDHLYLDTIKISNNISPITLEKIDYENSRNTNEISNFIISATVLISFYYDDKQVKNGIGVLISENQILTSINNVFNYKTNRQFEKFTIMIGYNNKEYVENIYIYERVFYDFNFPFALIQINRNKSLDIIAKSNDKLEDEKINKSINDYNYFGINFSFKIENENKFSTISYDNTEINISEHKITSKEHNIKDLSRYTIQSECLHNSIVIEIINGKFFVIGLIDINNCKRNNVFNVFNVFNLDNFLFLQNKLISNIFVKSNIIEEKYLISRGINDEETESCLLKALEIKNINSCENLKNACELSRFVNDFSVQKFFKTDEFDLKVLTYYNFTDLKSLILYDCNLVDNDIETLRKFNFQLMNSLIELDLSDNNLTSLAILNLSKCYFFQLRILNLDGNRLGNIGIESLLECDFNLTDLSISENNINDIGISKLIESKFPLKRLILKNNEIEHLGVLKGKFNELIELDISLNPLSECYLKELISCTFLSIQIIKIGSISEYTDDQEETKRNLKLAFPNLNEEIIFDSS